MFLNIAGFSEHNIQYTFCSTLDEFLFTWFTCDEIIRDERRGEPFKLLMHYKTKWWMRRDINSLILPCFDRPRLNVKISLNSVCIFLPKVIGGEKIVSKC